MGQLLEPDVCQRIQSLLCHATCRLWVHVPAADCLRTRLDQALLGPTSSQLLAVLASASMITIESSAGARHLREFHLAPRIAPLCIDENTWVPVTHRAGSRSVGRVLVVTDENEQLSLALALTQLQAEFGTRMEIEHAACGALDDDLALAHRLMSGDGFDLAVVAIDEDKLDAGIGCHWQMRLAICGVFPILALHPEHRRTLIPGSDCLMVEDTPEAWFQALRGLLDDRVRLRQCAAIAASNVAAGSLPTHVADFWVQSLMDTTSAPLSRCAAATGSVA
jgi:hypothetical protein